MPSDFVTLSCPTCGAKLEVTNDLERFACRYCGNEHLVRRSGGIVSLRGVTEGLKQVQVGVDKTAAELAIRRLKDEIGEIKAEMDGVAEHAQDRVAELEARIEAARPGKWFTVAVGFSLLLLISSVKECSQGRAGGIGLLGLLAGGACAVWFRGLHLTRRALARQCEEALAFAEESRSKLQERMAKLRKQLKKNRELVE